MPTQGQPNADDSWKACESLLERRTDATSLNHKQVYSAARRCAARRKSVYRASRSKGYSPHDATYASRARAKDKSTSDSSESHHARTRLCRHRRAARSNRHGQGVKTGDKPVSQDCRRDVAFNRFCATYCAITSTSQLSCAL